MKFKVTLDKRHSSGGWMFDVDVVVEAKSIHHARKVAEAQFPHHKVRGVWPVREPTPPKPRATQPQSPRGESAFKLGKSDPQGCLGVVAVFGGLFLVLALKSCFSGKPAPIPPAPQQVVAPAVVAPVVPEPNDEEPTVEDLGVDGSQDGNVVDETQLPPPEPEVLVTAPPAPVLHTYYARVKLPDGTTATLDLMAPSPEKAREILRDFRGDPEVLEGPALEQTW